MPLNNDWVEIFKAKKSDVVTCSQGRTHNGYDLMMKGYSTFNQEEFQPDLVIGHPKSNGPSFGKITKLKIIDKGNSEFGLSAYFEGVVPEIEQVVKGGSLTSRSASFDNKTGKLIHVGLLDGKKPGIKGLAPVQFSVLETTLTPITASFSETEELTTIDFYGTEEILQVEKTSSSTETNPPSKADVTTEEQELFEQERAKFEAEKAEFEEKREISKVEFEAKKQASEVRLATLEQELKKEKLINRTNEVTQFSAELVDHGVLTPKQIGYGEDAVRGVIEFSEGETHDLNSFMLSLDESQSDFFKKFVKSFPKQVEFSEVAITGVDDPIKSTMFSEAEIALDKKTKEYAAKHQVSYNEAANVVMGGQ
jgi:hypothetical protein